MTRDELLKVVRASTGGDRSAEQQIMDAADDYAARMIEVYARPATRRRTAQERRQSAG